MLIKVILALHSTQSHGDVVEGRTTTTERQNSRSLRSDICNNQQGMNIAVTNRARVRVAAAPAILTRPKSAGNIRRRESDMLGGYAYRHRNIAARRHKNSH